MGEQLFDVYSRFRKGLIYLRVLAVAPATIDNGSRTSGRKAGSHIAAGLAHDIDIDEPIAVVMITNLHQRVGDDSLSRIAKHTNLT